MYKFDSVEDTFTYMDRYLPKYPIFIEFGVYHADCFTRILKRQEEVGNPFIRAYGFDSFEGLPAETVGVYQNPEWQPGVFSVMKEYNLATVEDAINWVEKKINRDYVELVPGYFKDSLTIAAADRIGAGNVNYCHIDCDIHSSSLDVLNFIFKYRLLAEGCIIRFDDILSTPESGGQRLALRQAREIYHPMLEPLSLNVFLYWGMPG